MAGGAQRLEVAATQPVATRGDRDQMIHLSGRRQIPLCLAHSRQSGSSISTKARRLRPVAIVAALRASSLAGCRSWREAAPGEPGQGDPLRTSAGQPGAAHGRDGAVATFQEALRFRTAGNPRRVNT
jgi:hypothetical protein